MAFEFTLLRERAYAVMSVGSGPGPVFREQSGMVENIENQVLEQLRALRADVASVKEDTREIKTRLAVVESVIATLRRDNADSLPASLRNT